MPHQVRSIELVRILDQDGAEQHEAELPDEAADLSKGGLVVLETNHGPL